jgi:hypothetical protein
MPERGRARGAGQEQHAPSVVQRLALVIASCALNGYPQGMISAIFNAIRMVLGLVLDVITLPFRVVLALLGGAEFEFRRFSRK